MKYLTITLILLSILYACSYEGREYADIIFSDGVIYTSNSGQEVVDSFAIKDDKIIFVGSFEESKPYTNLNTQKIRECKKVKALLLTKVINLFVTQRELSSRIGTELFPRVCGCRSSR